MPRNVGKSIVWTGSLLFFLSSLLAQVLINGNIEGHLADPSGAPIVGAKVTATNTATGVVYSAVSSAEGLYAVRLLPAGTYTVTASQEGFQQIVRPGVLVDAGSNATINFDLPVGAVSTSVTVNAAGALIEAQTADRGNVIDTIRLDNFPSQTSNIFGLAFSAAGASPTSSQKSYTLYDNSNSTSLSVNGGQAGQLVYGATNQILIDGMDDHPLYNGGYVGVIPSGESMAEVKVVTSPYSAEYGRTTGGAVIAITKSGTNDFHGMAWDNTRVTGLAANTFERNLAGQPRSGVHFWQPGGDIGGPIKKNKLFFFYEMQSVLSHTPKSYTGEVPTQAQRNGDFSQTYYNNGGKPGLQLIYDPSTISYNAATGAYTRQVFPGNIIPSSRINPVAGANFWKYIPMPNSNGDPITLANNYTPTDNNAARSNIMEYVARVDWNINDSNRMTFRYTRNNFNSTDVAFYNSPADPNGANGLTRANHNAVADYTRTLSPTTVLDIRTGIERWMTEGFNPNRCQVSPSDLGFSATFVSQAQVPCFPVFNFGGSTLGSTQFSGAGSGSPNVNPDQINAIGGTVSKSAGRHSLKFGAQGLLERYYGANPGNNAGAFGFAQTGTNLNPQVTTPSAGNPVASFLLGVGTSSMDLNTSTARQNMSVAFYVQDDIAVTRKLKVNAGLRWDWDSSLTDRYNAITGVFSQTSVNPLAAQVKSAAGVENCPACANLVGGVLFPGVGGQPRSPYDSSLRNFGPRLGAAYALNDRTVIRAGWGLFYGAVIWDPGSVGYSQTTNSVLYDSSYNVVNYINNPFPTGLVQPTGSQKGLMTNVGSSISFVDPHAREPRSQQFSFDVQREVGWNTLLTAGFVYNGISRLPISRNLNALTDSQVLLGSAVLNNKVANPFSGLVPGFALNQSTIAYSSLIVPYPEFTTVTENDIPIGTSSYHGLQLQANKRFSSGLSLTIAYTWSKHLGRYGYQNAGDPLNDLQKSFDLYDIPHLVVISESWQIPFGRSKLLGRDMPRWLDAIIGGWVISGNVRLQSGAPDFVATNAIPVGGVDPNAPNQSVDQWINPAAFALNTNPYSLVGWSQAFSNLRLPWIHNFDLQGAKDVPITERVKFSFITNWVNAFNTPQFWNPPGACNSPSASCFGKIAGYQTQTNLPRQIQLGGRVTF